MSVKAYQRIGDVEAAPMGAETILYHSETNKFVVLNETAAFVWQLLVEPRTEDELLERVCAGFGGAIRDDVSTDIREALKQFDELQMVATKG